LPTFRLVSKINDFDLYPGFRHATNRPYKVRSNKPL
jgi:hypothetical protein